MHSSELTTNIHETARATFDSMYGLAVSIVDDRSRFDKRTAQVSALISFFAPDQEVMILIHMGERLAHLLARKMDAADHELGQLSVDSLCELANIIGGNIKVKVEHSSKLSIPSLVKGSSFEVKVPQGKKVDYTPLVFMVEGEAFLVECYWQRYDAALIASQFEVERFKGALADVTTNVLKATAHIDVWAEAPTASSYFKADRDITAVIGFHTLNTHGKLVFQFDLEFAVDLAQQLTGETLDPAERDAMAKDAMGELLNMIMGNVKLAFDDSLQISLPSVALGGLVTVPLPFDLEVKHLVMPFKSLRTKFEADIYLVEKATG